MMNQRNTMGRLILVLIGCIFMETNAPVQAEEFSKVETFNCGRLGAVTLSSTSKPIMAAGHVAYRARITISSRNIKQAGILHNSMGGNDRTFTRKATDNFRSVDDTSFSNPVMMNILGKGYLYGKERQQIKVVTLREAYSCIPS